MEISELFAFKNDGQPLALEHGYPVRLVVPHLYVWKSVKVGARHRADGRR